MTATPDARPLPRPTDLSQPFWDACRSHRLTAQRCEDCGTYVFPPQDYCRHCFSTRLAWVPVSGKATVYSYTIIWRPQSPAFTVPYAVGIMDMAEGYQMLSNLVGCPVEAIRVGLEVEVTFEDRSETISLPVFRPVAR